MALPIVHVRDIPEEGVTIAVPLDAAWARAALHGTEFVPASDPCGRATVTVQLLDDDVSFDGSVTAHFTAPCVRCLQTTPVDVSANFRLHLTPQAATANLSRHAEVDLSADDLDTDHYDGERVDVGHWIREQLLVEATVFPRCPDACAVPLVADSAAPSSRTAIDPRLAALQKFSRKE